MDDLCLAPFPVTFEPHWADERMLWLTAGSIAVSGVLGWLAYWNGRKASRIAQEAAARDEVHREDESDLRAQRERNAVAEAMLKGVESAVVWVDTAPGIKNPATEPALAQFRQARAHAHSKIALHPHGDVEALRSWFNQEFAKIVALGRDMKPRYAEVDEIARQMRKKIVMWSAGDWEPELQLPTES